MTIQEILQFFSAAFIAELIGTMGGFGSATIFTPLAALFVNIKTAIVLITVFHFTGALTRTIYFLKHISWKIFGWFMVTDIALTAVGAVAISHISDYYVRFIFGSFLILYGAMALILPKKEIITKMNKTKLLIWGAVSGFLAGLLGTGGAARTAALQSFNLRKETYLGTSGAMGMVTDIVRLPIYLSAGVAVVTTTNTYLAGGLVLVAFAGATLGSYLATKFPNRLFRKFIYLLLLLAGVYLLLS